jgi:methylthioribose-1-phosphate isomerase
MSAPFALVSRVSPLRVLDSSVEVLDQRRLPHVVDRVTLTSAAGVAQAIATLAVRGAPLIGVAALYGLWLGAREAAAAGAVGFAARLEASALLLRNSRPTAVNLFHAVDAGMAAAAPHLGAPQDCVDALKAVADGWARADQEACDRLSRLGAALLPDEGGVLTHCNAGALATMGVGTALGVIRAAVAMGKKLTVYADETRPLLQGARLTCWELQQDGIGVVLLPDGAAPSLLASGRVHAAVVGADRIAANGDVANKVGTYGVALACGAHGVPLYVAAPWTTVDLKCADGRAIPIEQRAASEVTGYGQERWAAPGVDVFNPSFDVTPARLVAALATDRGVVREPYAEGLRTLSA